MVVAPANPVPTRASLLRGVPALTLAFELQPHSATAAEAWRSEIPRTLKGLQRLQQKWESEIDTEGRATAGANLVREWLTIKYSDVFEVSIPPGEKVGIDVGGAKVVGVSRPELGWKEGDIITKVNGVPTKFLEKPLEQTVSQIKNDGEALSLVAEREGTALLDNLESKLKTAYVALDDGNFPDLEEVQIKTGELKVQAASAASSTSVSPEVMRRLKSEIDVLVKLLAPVAKAVA